MASNNLPAVSADGAGNGFAALQAKLSVLQRAVGHCVEHSQLVKKRMRKAAKAADRLADLSAAAEVAPSHIGAVRDIDKQFDGAATVAGQLIGSFDRLNKAVAAAKAAHRTEYGGIRNAVVSSSVRQAKPGWYRQT
ncbi:hypothetical protein [Streptomyces coeruleorubidus]|uniref:Conjugal transfer protein TraB n=1 Tax=Streptomyces coeruleorubidus TaxID=116188 RepID=A0ABZ0KT85_STRC4|nr:hypothetical protein [Streptomyces coeruleorubidus]WOT40666.1 hypothetical protein R5U08_41995 [Streptomyces coeruleorubidus]